MNAHTLLFIDLVKSRGICYNKQMHNKQINVILIVLVRGGSRKSRKRGQKKLMMLFYIILGAFMTKRYRLNVKNFSKIQEKKGGGLAPLPPPLNPPMLVTCILLACRLNMQL